MPSPYRSEAEADYAGQLQVRKLAGDILHWEHEPARWKVGAGKWYKPDFLVIAADSVFEIHEVKDMRRPRAQLETGINKLHTLATLYPFLRYWLAARDASGWSFIEVAETKD